jgi:hypothetical protein
MPPKPAATTAAATRNRNGSLSTPDEFQDIKDSQDARKYLEKFSLLCPPGEPASNGALSICLHQIAAMKGIPKQALNAVRATAFLLERVEEEAINEKVRSAFESQITEFTSDMKLLVEDVNTKIDTHLKEAMEQWTQTVKSAPQPTATNHSRTTPTAATNNYSYASALINPPPHVNPKLAAREGIRARQFVVEGAEQSDLARLDHQKLKEDMNKALRDLGASEGNVRSIVAQREGEGTLIEVDSDELAKWLTNGVNRAELCGKLGDRVTFRPRRYNVLVFNVPLTIDPTNPVHREELNEVNGTGDINSILALRWAKPINRRSPNQRSAHLVLTFTDPKAANRAISNGITICNKKCHAERVKKEPLRCMKCQGWNHMAKQCEYTNDKCSNCAGGHKSEACSHPRSRRCVSCKTDDHASWSRECPIFLRKAEELNARHPENLMPFFPTDDPWTWSTGANKPAPTLAKQNAPKTTNIGKGKQKENRPGGPLTSYNPGAYPSQTEFWANNSVHDDAPHLNWWGVNSQVPPGNPSQTAQPSTSVNIVNTNSGTAGPSNSIPYPNV